MTMPNDNRLRFLRDTCYGERSFYTSINRVEMISILDELMLLRSGGGDPTDHALPREPEFGWEGVAERLRKVEDSLSDLRNGVRENYKLLHERIDKVAEIIGERVSGLVDDIAAVRDSAKRAHERLDGFAAAVYGVRAIDAAFAALPPDAHGTIGPGEMERVLQAVSEVAFPTGGASTVEDVLASLKPGDMAVWTHDTPEAATDAVLPVPQRGDRVRLEGAQSVGYTTIADGWYDVLGQQAGSFQVRFTSDRGTPSDIVGLGLFWIDNQHPGLKEVQSHVTR